MTVAHEDHFYIDGKWQPASTAERAPIVNPATEQVIAEVALGSAADVGQAVAAAARAFATYSQSPVEERARLLDRVFALINQRAELFVNTMVAEMGVAISYARTAQLHFGVEHIRVAAEVARQYEFLRYQGTTAVVREPIGVCGLITPWNWPLYQVTVKVAPAIAAGCTMVLKPSELAPLTANLFAQVLHDAGTPPGVFNLVNGSGDTVGAALAAHPQVDMVSITGSTRAGALVAQAAAPTIKRVVQELGGKSPNVFLDDADFGAGVAKGVAAAFRNVGQSCSAPTRMLVPTARLAEVEALAVAAAAGIRVGDPTLVSTALGPIANAAQYRRVQALIAAGIDEGARLLCGGPGHPPDMDRGYFARPTIFSDVTTEMRIAREEIFGPVLSIMPYRDEDDAVRIANSTTYGLGAQVQSGDLERARRIAARIRSGQVHINYPDWDPYAPFGGYRQSGNGREFGVHGLEEYLETKAILGYR
ncbi:MAG: aldehyde dehydrogenase family protein [Steroidobacteraceae bacterium]